MSAGLPQADAAALAADLPADALDFLERVELRMHELLSRRDGLVVDAARHAVEAGGKRLRPLLVRAAAPVRAERDAALVIAAASVELIHTASLIHDDLLDGASLRRGASTVHALHGDEIAVAAGDLLFSLAFTGLLELRATLPERVVADAVVRVARSARTLAEGEALQQLQAGDLALSVVDYLRRCEQKTGELFGLAMELAVLLCEGDPGDAASLGEFGRAVGTAFQVADDVLDCSPAESAAQLGKIPGADLRDGTVTLPILLGVGRDPALGGLLATFPPVDIADVLIRIRACGALDDASAAARQLADAALEALAALRGSYDETALRAVAAASVERLQ